MDDCRRLRAAAIDCAGMEEWTQLPQAASSRKRIAGTSGDVTTSHAASTAAAAAAAEAFLTHQQEQQWACNRLPTTAITAAMGALAAPADSPG